MLYMKMCSWYYNYSPGLLVRIIYGLSHADNYLLRMKHDKKVGQLFSQTDDNLVKKGLDFMCVKQVVTCILGRLGWFWSSPECNGDEEAGFVL